MATNNNILLELQELKSTLANMAVQNIYTVPDGYFEGLAGQVLNRIKAMEATSAAEELGYLSPMLSGVSKQMPYTIPEGYFESLESGLLYSTRNITDEGAKDELEILSPLLSGLNKKMPYAVPEDYFANLSEKAVANENKKAPAKIISIGSKWFRYAAAAVVASAIVLVGFFITNNTKKESGEKVMANFSKDLKKLKLNDTQEDKLIEDYLDAGLTGKEMVKLNPGNNAPDVINLLKDVPEDELNDLQEQSEAMEDVMMTN